MGRVAGAKMAIRMTLLCLAMAISGSHALQYHFQLEWYKDNGCTQRLYKAYYPRGENTGVETCTPSGGQPASATRGSYKTTTGASNRFDAYASVDCSGTAQFSHTTSGSAGTCTQDSTTGLWSKMLSFNFPAPATGFIQKDYMGTDASTASCVTETHDLVYIQKPLKTMPDSCIWSPDHNSFMKIDSCSGSQYTYTLYGSSDSACATTVSTATGNLSPSTCTVSNEGSTTAGSYEMASIQSCAPSTNSAAGKMGLSIFAVGVSFVALTMMGF